MCVYVGMILLYQEAHKENVNVWNKDKIFEYIGKYPLTFFDRHYIDRYHPVLAAQCHPPVGDLVEFTHEGEVMIGEFLGFEEPHEMTVRIDVRGTIYATVVSELRNITVATVIE